MDCCNLIGRNVIVKSMTTQTQQADTKFARLEREIKILRSALISIVGKDKEGEYRPEFVRRIIKAAEERPSLTFVNPRSFLNQLKRR